MFKVKARFLPALVMTLGIAAMPAFAAEFVNVLTGGTSGVYYPLGVALSEIYGEGMPGARTQVQATKASVENLNLLQQGKGEIAFSLADSVKLGWEGNTEAGFPAKLDKLRAVGAIYPNFIQIVASRDSGIKSLADLKGKSLSVGAPASGTELNARAILAAAGMSYEDMGRVEYLPFAESVELIEESSARRHPPVGRARCRLDPRSRDVPADQCRRRAGRRRRQDRRALRSCGHSRRHL